MNGNKSWQRNLLNSAVAASMLFGATLAGAATNGAIGPTSTGSVDLTILVPDLVLVTNLDDISFTHDRVDGAAATETFCVWSTPGVGYNLTVSSLSPTGSDEFVASSGTEFMPYSVAFAANSTGLDSVVVTEGATFDDGGAGFASNTGAEPGCGGTDNAWLQISTPDSLGLAPSAGIYEDTLTLVVSPI
jgi:hypothetical protein